MKKRLVVASQNAGKIKEIAQILPEYDIVSMQELGFNEDIEETGKTFYENSLIKAKTVSKALNLPVIADDSGLCVDCLNGEPGIYSARYAGDRDNKHNIEKLLKNMQGKEDRKAHFSCCIVFYKPNGNTFYVNGETYGEILLAPEGENGFGYDPVFYSYDLKKSMGIATEEEKNSVSHRGRALQKFKSLIKEYL